MKKLKQLFGKRALASTVGAALLGHSAVVALATDCYTTSAIQGNPGCVSPDPTCFAVFSDGRTRFWCCTYPKSCGGSASSTAPWIGWCCSP